MWKTEGGKGARGDGLWGSGVERKTDLKDGTRKLS